MKSGRRGFRNKRECISWRSIKSCQFESVQEGENVLLPALLAFVDIRIKVDIGYVTVEHRTGGLDHTIRKLRAHAYRVSTKFFQKSKND